MNKHVLIIISVVCYGSIAMAASDNNAAVVEADAFNFEVLGNAAKNKLDLPACVENLPDLSICAPHICTIKAGFGEIFVKVKGMSGGKCQYVERTFGLDGVDCMFKKDELKALDSLFTKRFKKLSGVRVFFTEQEYTNMADVFKKECKIVPDYNSSRIIPINKINDNEIDPELNIDELMKYAQATKLQAIAPKPNEVHNQETKATLGSYRSIMLPPNTN